MNYDALNELLHLAIVALIGACFGFLGAARWIKSSDDDAAGSYDDRE